jgi:hypothetical protein
MAVIYYHNRDVDKLNAEIQDYENFVSALRSTTEPRTAEWIKSLLDKVCLLLFKVLDISAVGC